MKAVITGASGFVGRGVSQVLRDRGDEVVALKHGRDWQWQPDGVAGEAAASGHVRMALLQGCDAVIHLAGQSIASRWNAKRKREIHDSRVMGTRVIAQAIASLPPQQRPRVMVSASAIGYYGCRGDEILTEHSTPGQSFFAHLASEWEAAATPARQAGVRVVHPRLGLVLDPSGGALAKMLPVFKLGGGGILGDGRQYVSWITLADVVAAILFVMDHPTINGPVNFVAPEAVTNRVFTRTLGKALGRPTFVPVPRFALRLAMGQMADETLLCSARIKPEALQQAGFTFTGPSLEPALQAMF